MFPRQAGIGPRDNHSDEGGTPGNIDSYSISYSVNLFIDLFIYVFTY